VQAGVTVALVAVPQCMGFAAIAGLPPAMGLYSAVVMGLVNGLMTTSSKSIIGPAITISSMVYGVLASVARDEPASWPAIAGLLAIMVGGFTLILAILRVGDLVRFVSRSVLVGLTVGVGILIFGAQLGPFMGIPLEREPRLVTMLFNIVKQAGNVSWADLLMGTATMLMVIAGGKLGRRFPAAFVAIVLGGAMVWLLPLLGANVELARIEAIPRELPALNVPAYHGPFWTDLVFGAAAITLVGIIQTLALSKAFAAKAGTRIQPRRELLALGCSNLAAGACGGFPGAESMSRSAINDMAGARSRWAGIFCALITAGIVLIAAPLFQYITKSAIAGLMLATAWSVVDWHEVREILTSARHDRIVLLTTLGCLLVLPIHWAVMIGLAASIAIFLRRASRLHLVEMVAGQGRAFLEHPIDQETGRSPVTMLQVEGPLFFAHAEEVAETLKTVFERNTLVTILRMRRTQQIDFSVIAEMNRVVQRYLAAGGQLIICGLSPRMHNELLRGPLGRTLDPKYLLPTTRKVFGSAHAAIELAERIARPQADAAPCLLRQSEESSVDESKSEAAWSYNI